MIRFQAFGTHFTLPLLGLLFPFLAHSLGLSGEISPMLLALFAHESAHILAARLRGVEIREIRLMPFGGSARMENPYGLSAGRLILVAAAGPLSNLLLAVLAAACAHWGWMSPFRAALHIRTNLTLMSFNLLPALPLDGGRMLFSLLSPVIGERRALQTGILAGRLLSIAMLALCAYGGFRSGVWNLTLLLAAVFIFTSEQDERAALSTSRGERIANLMRQDAAASSARFYQLDAENTVEHALSLIRPKEHSWFLLTQEGIPLGLLNDHSLLNHLLNNGKPEASLAELKAWTFFAPDSSGKSVLFE